MTLETPHLLQLYIPLPAPIATLAIVLAGFICNNSRLDDFSGRFNDLGARMGDLREDLLRRIDDCRDLLGAEMQVEIEKLRSEMREDRAGTFSRYSRITSDD